MNYVLLQVLRKTGLAYLLCEEGRLARPTVIQVFTSRTLRARRVVAGAAPGGGGLGGRGPYQSPPPRHMAWERTRTPARLRARPSSPRDSCARPWPTPGPGPREKKLYGPTDKTTLHSGNNLVYSLVLVGQHAEAKTLSRKVLSQCRRVLGPEDNWTLYVRQNYAETLCKDTTASRADILQGVAMLEDVARVRRRVFGARHPETEETLTELEGARMRREDVAA